MKNIVKDYILSIIFDRKTSLEKKNKTLRKFFFKMWKINMRLNKIDYESIRATPMDEQYIDNFIINIMQTNSCELNKDLEKQSELIAWIIEKNEKQKIFYKYI